MEGGLSQMVSRRMHRAHSSQLSFEGKGLGCEGERVFESMLCSRCIEVLQNKMDNFCSLTARLCALPIQTPAAIEDHLMLHTKAGCKAFTAHTLQKLWRSMVSRCVAVGCQWHFARHHQLMNACLLHPDDGTDLEFHTNKCHCKTI